MKSKNPTTPPPPAPAPMTDWIQLSVTSCGLYAIEIPEVGCLVRCGGDIRYVPGVRIYCRDNQRWLAKLDAPAVMAPTTVTTTLNPVQFTMTEWTGDAGIKLDSKLHELELIEKLDRFVKKQWKVKPTVAELKALLHHLKIR